VTSASVNKIAGVDTELSVKSRIDMQSKNRKHELEHYQWKVHMPDFRFADVRVGWIPDKGSLGLSPVGGTRGEGGSWDSTNLEVEVLLE